MIIISCEQINFNLCTCYSRPYLKIIAIKLYRASESRLWKLYQQELNGYHCVRVRLRFRVSVVLEDDKPLGHIG